MRMSFDFDALTKNDDVPVINKNGLRYVWIENINLSGMDEFEMVSGALTISFKDKAGKTRQDTYDNVLLGSPYFIGEPLANVFSKDMNDLNCLGIYALQTEALMHPQ